jgi:hypothetical protein
MVPETRPYPSRTFLVHQLSRQLWAAAQQTSTTSTTSTRQQKKQELLEWIQSTPSGLPTPYFVTRNILNLVESMEKDDVVSPTIPESQLLNALAGTWELLWTAQDPKAPETFGSWVNPLENQAYSNNPKKQDKTDDQQEGQASPFLPIPVQRFLQERGILAEAPSIRSTQSIDIHKRRVRNVVVFDVLGNRQARVTLTVNIDFTVDDRDDPRRVHVKFQSTRCKVGNLPSSWDIPLGILGPRGWLRTVYIDHDMRITRGHKGSVFILTRPKNTKNKSS